MILTPHAIIGAALANAFPDNPALGFSLAFISHYAVDMLPHTDYDITNFLDSDTKTVKSVLKNTGSALHLLLIVADFLFAVFLCFLLFVRDEKTALITLVGIIGGLLPDFFQLLYYKFKNQPWTFFQKIHEQFHDPFEFKNKKQIGILFQFIVPILVLIIYFLLKS